MKRKGMIVAAFFMLCVILTTGAYAAAHIISMKSAFAVFLFLVGRTSVVRNHFQLSPKRTTSTWNMFAFCLLFWGYSCCNEELVPCIGMVFDTLP